MKFKELVILLPCHSLEDFPVYSEGEEAEGLLAAWTSLWHPALIHSAQSMPTWCRMDDPPEELEGRLLVIPPVSHTELPTGFFQRAKETGGCPIRRKLDRNEIIEAALESLHADEPAENITRFDDEFVNDFFALGFAYLQVQILTRQMRYSSNLDEVHFANQVVAAVNAARSGDNEQANEKLTGCFDLLSEERDLFYSVDSYLIDLIMLTPTTLGSRLAAELQSNHAITLMLTAGVLEALNKDETGRQLMDAIRSRWAEQSVGIIACDSQEGPLPLLPMEAVAQQLKRGRDQVVELLGQSPTVFGRRRYGLTPALPQLLRKLKIPYALHATLEEGRFPEGSQIKTLWQGGDGSTVDAIAKAPLNASLPETFLGIALKTGETMDMDHVATLVLAHWPGGASPFLQDLHRAARRSKAIGQFETIDKYFTTTSEPHEGERFPPSRCRSPYLRQAVIRRQTSPLERWAAYHRSRAKAEAAHSLTTLASFVDQKPRETVILSALEQLDQRCETAELAELPEHSEELTAAARSANDAIGSKAGDGSGVTVWNPHANVRRVLVPLPGFSHPPEQQGAIYAVESGDGGVGAIVDVPPMGYAHLTPAAAPTKRRGRPDPVLADGMLLQNEFAELTINPRTGGIGSVQSYETRGNRLSQQLSVRTPGEAGQRATYSSMMADKVETIVATRLQGAIRSTGRLVGADGETAATFQQTVRITRGSRVIELDIELDALAELKSDPWNSYIASRVAWQDEASEVACDVNQTRHGMGDRKRLDALHYIDISNPVFKTTLFPRGLPYHRRVGLASLDTLLLVRGETARQFQLGIGVDVAYPLQEAIAMAAPPVVLNDTTTPSTPSAWLCHLQSRNVIATRWLARTSTADGKVTGFQVRLLETSGRSGQVKLQTLRPLTAARIVDLDGATLAECRVEDGAAHLELAAREWLIVEAEWQA